MSKALLVIDMPSSCATCEIRWGCKIWSRWEGYSDRLDGCPLKPTPERKDISDRKITYEELRERIGWNTCLEEIEK